MLEIISEKYFHQKGKIADNKKYEHYTKKKKTYKNLYSQSVAFDGCETWTLNKT